MERALIVTSADARRELEEVLGSGKTWGIEVSYSEAPETDGRQTVLTQTSQALSDGPVLVYPADCLFPGQVAAMRNRFSEGDVDCVLLALAAGSSSPELRTFATAIMLGPRTQPVLPVSLSHGHDPRELAEILLARGCRVAVSDAAKQWRYSNATERLLSGNRMVLDDLPLPAADGVPRPQRDPRAGGDQPARACVRLHPAWARRDRPRSHRRRLVRRPVHSHRSRCHGTRGRARQHHGPPVRRGPQSRPADRSKHHRRDGPRSRAASRYRRACICDSRPGRR